MTENEINITDMIKALQCVASQDADGDCYCDHFNAHLTCEQFGDNARLDEKHMSCGGVLKDTQSCPYSQKTYGVCYEDGELWWLKDIVSILEEIQQYRAIGTIEELKALKEKSVPIVTGEWIDTQPQHNNGYYKNAYVCSNCNDYYTTEYDEMKFCPNCGAKMTET